MLRYEFFKISFDESTRLVQYYTNLGTVILKKKNLNEFANNTLLLLLDYVFKTILVTVKVL